MLWPKRSRCLCRSRLHGRRSSPGGKRTRNSAGSRKTCQGQARLCALATTVGRRTHLRLAGPLSPLSPRLRTIGKNTPRRALARCSHPLLATLSVKCITGTNAGLYGRKKLHSVVLIRLSRVRHSDRAWSPIEKIRLSETGLTLILAPALAANPSLQSQHASTSPMPSDDSLQSDDSSPGPPPFSANQNPSDYGNDCRRFPKLDVGENSDSLRGRIIWWQELPETPVRP